MRDGEQMCIIGGAAQLGNWQLQQVLPLVHSGRCCWEVEVQLPASALPCTYKYGVQQVDGTLQLEHGENRMVALPAAAAGAGRAPALLLRQDGFFRRQQRWRGAGLAVPVFSLRTAASFGSGEFLDLLPLVDFCGAVGLCLIQLLPVNDTSVRCTWRDSYPYSSLCVFALHPLYLRLEALAGLCVWGLGGRGVVCCMRCGRSRKESWWGGWVGLCGGGGAERGSHLAPPWWPCADSLPPHVAAEVSKLRPALDLPEVDYEVTVAAKLRLARAVFDAQGHGELEGSEFKEFCSRNWEWLRPYAVFCFLRDLFGTAEHWRWGTLAQPTTEVRSRAARTKGTGGGGAGGRARGGRGGGGVHGPTAC